MRIAIVGSRNWPQLELVERYVQGLDDGTVVVSGGARGVDLVAEMTARRSGLIQVVVHPAWARDDGTTDRSAGHRRNELIVDLADEVVAFWDGISRGTAGAVSYARATGKPVRVVAPGESL